MQDLKAKEYSTQKSAIYEKRKSNLCAHKCGELSFGLPVE